ncbi:Signal transduction histidine kinase [Dyadobacter sp. SG02]|uniref:sensor histidine kinase n=1 Tax=Dyadobacter sp. SG02 TaxID=1855291 RepID=UPI0008C79A1B|nr:HAMP domain-containing sensor histidine kinase [Dyadobacter sp. SG02]SEJ50590.1 Signal transduction histidine kinase [Dyadobacter sp. SG02]
MMFHAAISPLDAQTISKNPKYTLRHYTSEDGLSQNSVNAITRDRDGFIWLTTNMGLSRFDGQSLVTFGKDRFKLEYNAFIGFTGDIEGKPDRLYALGDGGKNHVRIVDGEANVDKNPMEEHLLKIFKPDEKSRGLMYTLGLPDPWHKDWIPEYCVFLLPESNGDFFVWTTGGKVELYRNWKLQKTYMTGIPSPVGFFRVGINLYYDDGKGYMRFVASAGTAIAGGEVSLVPAPGESAGPNLRKQYKVFADELSGNSFIYQDGQLFQLSETSPGRFLTKLLLSDFDFDRNSVTSVFYEGPQRRLYLGTMNSGFYIFDFEVFETLVTGAADPGANVYYAQAAFSDSTVLTPSFHILGKGKGNQNILNVLPNPVGKTLDRYIMLRDRSGDIWMAGYRRLYRLDKSSQKVKGSWPLENDITVLYQDDSGRIWIGTYSAGLKYIDPEEQGATVSSYTPRMLRIAHIIRENKDILWVATYWDLYRVNLARKTLSKTPAAAKNNIRSLWLERPGELWFTTYENGFFVLKNGHVTRFPLDRDRSLANAHCIMSDKKGYLWIPTNNGLFRVLRRDLLDYISHGDSTRLYYHRYNKQSGFRTNEFNGGCQPCAVRLRNGYVSLPSIDGMVFFKPEETPIDTPDSKIFIDRIEADSRQIQARGSRIELSDVNNIQVFVSSPYLGDRRNQQLYYMVSSDDKASPKHVWYPIENEQQSVLLNNLSSGTYTLKLRKNGGFGPDSIRMTTLTIVIPYAWYETWPFRIALALLVLAGIYLYVKNRLKEADRQNKILESRVSERTRNLQDTLGVLKASEHELLRQTRLQMHLIASISHDIRSPLRSIEFASGKVPDLLQKGDLNLVETIGSGVNESSRRVLLLLENMLSYIKSQMSGGSVAQDTFAARSLVDEVAVIFNASFKVQGNRFVNNVPETLVLKSNRQLLKIILHNLIDNANKYSAEGSVIVTASEESNVVRILVTDTGPGLPETVLNWFNDNDAIYEDSPESGPSVHGIGLVIVKELAGMLNVRIRATSASGAAFAIEFWEREGL